MDATYTCNFLTSMSDHMETSTVPSSSNLWSMRDTQFSENSLSEWSNPTQTQGSTSITCSSISDIEGAEWPPAHLAASICSGTDVNEQLKELAVNLGQENFNTSSGVAESDQSSTGIFGSATENISWSSLLLGVGGTETLQSLENSSMEGFSHDLYSWTPNKVGHLAELTVRNSEDQDFSVKGLGLEETEVNRTCGQAQYAPGQDIHQTDRLFDLDAWSNMDQSKTPVTGGLPIQEFALSLLDFPISNRRRKESPKVKQKTDIYFNSSSMGNSSSSLHILGSDACGAGSMTTFPGQPVRSNLSFGETVSVRYPISSNGFPRRWIANTSEFPTMLSQLLPGSSAKHGNSHGGSSMGRSYLDCNNVRPDRGQQNVTKRSDYSCFTDVSLAPPFQREVKLEPHSTVSRKKTGQSMDEGRQLLLDSARSACSLSSTEFTNQSYFKRPRLEQTNLSFKIVQPRKEKVSERIAELQQLVSPFGKTDQASVLTEVLQYIKCMHEQIQQLSTPYPKNNGASTLHPDAARNCWSSDKTKEENRQDLKGRGLCLVPLSCTLQVASHNATECWASMHFGGGTR
ncbi:hypothetical protein O6H91_15G023000 [Diphasiastrum complanatum]|uniref:Uncharacterized protein n=1 Tax=Diphasiastrum complanatum TaxID=34168 RepID=A0ACC2BGB9_DIPCM|nr:hypothetical protein O6H91_15G023000 [Diphasiastrum complanatum]